MCVITWCKPSARFALLLPREACGFSDLYAVIKIKINLRQKHLSRRASPRALTGLGLTFALACFCLCLAIGYAVRATMVQPLLPVLALWMLPSYSL